MKERIILRINDGPGSQETTTKFDGVGVIVIHPEKPGKIVLVQERTSTEYKEAGEWSIPSGRVNVGESIEEAAVREVFEETGYKVEIVRKTGVYEHELFTGHALVASVVGEPTEDFQIDSDIEQTLWVDSQEALTMQLRINNAKVIQDSLEFIAK